MSIPFVSLLSNAEIGLPLEVTFKQRAYEVSAESAFGATGEMKVVSVEDEGDANMMFVSETPGCVLTVRAIASHMLLQDWCAVNK